MGFTVTPTKNTYGVIGDKELKRFMGEIRGLRIQLAERIEVSHDVMVTDDQYPILLLGNDLFNKSKVQTLHYNDAEGIATIRSGDRVDVMELTLLSPEESRANQLPPAKEGPPAPAPTSYEHLALASIQRAE